jgi:hypothetical protein
MQNNSYIRIDNRLVMDAFMPTMSEYWDNEKNELKQAEHSKAVSEWENRPSYPINPSDEHLFKEGQTYELVKDFEIRKRMSNEIEKTGHGDGWIFKSIQTAFAIHKTNEPKPEGVDLKKLSEKFSEILSKYTAEDFEQWVKEKEQPKPEEVDMNKHPAERLRNKLSPFMNLAAMVHAEDVRMEKAIIEEAALCVNLIPEIKEYLSQAEKLPSSSPVQGDEQDAWSWFYNRWNPARTAHENIEAMKQYFTLTKKHNHHG